MIIYTDSEILNLKKFINKSGILIDNIIDINNFNEKDLKYSSDSLVLLLITETVYKWNLSFFKSNDSYFTNKLSNLISFFSSKSKKIIFPLIPYLYLYDEINTSSNRDKNSHFQKVNFVNNYIIRNFSIDSNIFLIKGLTYISNEIRRDYFRFKSIYNKSNSIELVKQIIDIKKQLTSEKKKLIIFDLDNTLWKGIIGEDGIEGIRMSEGDNVGSIFSFIQSKLLSLKNNGFLLAVCSKNDQSIALEGLFKHKDSKFKEKDIVSYRINWDTKSSNINNIIDELNISLNHTIFIDDSEHECDEVRNNCPGITVLNVPKDIYKYPEIFQNDCFFFDDIEKDNIDRTSLYKNRELRKNYIEKISKTSNSKDDWLKSLNIKIIFERVTILSQSKKRVVQLFNRTNQFNLRSSNYNLDTLEKALNLKNNFYYQCNLKDRIGSEGMISVIGLEITDQEIFVKDFIMSCRVFGRNIEKIVLLPIIKKAREDDLIIRFNLIDNDKNKSVQEFIKKITDQNLIIKNQEIKKLENKYSNLPLKMYGNNDLFKEI